MPASRSLRAVTGPTPQSASTGSCSQEALDALRRDHRQAVGLAPARRDLGEELVRRHARRRGEAGLLVDSPLQFASQPRWQAASPQLFSVTSRYASSSDSGSTSGVHVAQDRHDLRRHRLVLVEVRPHDDQLRAKPHRARHRHRRAHAELARLVARRRHHAAPLGAAAHRHRPAAQRGIVALLHRGVEGVHVQMDNAPHILYILPHMDELTDRQGEILRLIKRADRGVGLPADAGRDRRADGLQVGQRRRAAPARAGEERRDRDHPPARRAASG